MAPDPRPMRQSLLPSLLCGASALLLLARGFAPGPAAAQDTAPADSETRSALTPELAAEIDALQPNMEAVVTEALRSRAAYLRLVRLCAEAPGRLAGSVQATKGVAWAVAELESLPFDKVWLEEMEVPHWERGAPEVCTISGPQALAGEAFNVLALGGSIGTPEGGVSGPVLRVTSFEELAERADEARGAIVFFDASFNFSNRSMFAEYGNTGKFRRSGPSEAGKAGAVACVIRSLASVIDDNPHTGTMQYDERAPKVPAAALSTLDADRLAGLCTAGPVELSLTMNCEWFEPARGHNVIGDYTGSEFPDEIVIVGGHLDSWDVAQGAHDDGAGCCHAIEVVRTLGALGIRPKRTIRVVLYANEENGLRGARDYVARHLEDMPNHVFGLESDSGGFTPRGFTTNSGDEGYAILERIVSHLEEESADQLWRGGSGGADVGQMAPHGVPVAGYRPDDERYFAYHHTPADTIEAVNERELNLGAAVISALVYAVADLPTRLPNNLPD